MVAEGSGCSVRTVGGCPLNEGRGWGGCWRGAWVDFGGTGPDGDEADVIGLEGNGGYGHHLLGAWDHTDAYGRLSRVGHTLWSWINTRHVIVQVGQVGRSSRLAEFVELVGSVSGAGAGTGRWRP